MFILKSDKDGMYSFAKLLYIGYVNLFHLVLLFTDVLGGVGGVFCV